MENLIHPPWTREQVASLNAYQQSGRFHPFTCGGGQGGNSECRRSVLVATTDGWGCPRCGYRQDWAHSFMADGSWERMGRGPFVTDDYAIAPAETIKDEMKERGWSVEQVVELMYPAMVKYRSRQDLTKEFESILQGGPIKDEHARGLGVAFGTSWEFWRNLEANYRSDLKRLGGIVPATDITIINHD